MDRENKYRYLISVENQNAPGSPSAVVRAETGDGAAEVVRILLAQKDDHIVTITVRPERVL